MKSKVIAVAFGLLLAMTVPVAHAQDQDSVPGPPPSAGNGPASQGGQSAPQGADADARRQMHRQRMLQRFDTNHDGVLDDQEKAAMRAWRQQHRRQGGGGNWGGGLGDSGGPGGWSGAPGGAGGGMGAGAGGGMNSGGGRQQWRQRMLQKFDLNHDGVLDDNEKAQMRQFMQRRREMRQNQQNGQNQQSGQGGSGALPESPPEQQ